MRSKPVQFVEKKVYATAVLILNGIHVQMKFQLENIWQYIGILVLLFGSLIIYSLSTEFREGVIGGKRQIIQHKDLLTLTKLIFRLAFFHHKTWILTIRKHKTCRTPAGKTKGRADRIAIIVLIVYILFFLNSGALFWLMPQTNLWGFDRMYKIPNLDFIPYAGKYLYFVSVCWNSQHLFISAWFYSVYGLIGLAGLNKVVDVWFPHSEKAKLVRAVILDDKDLPDDYQSIMQLNRDQVRVRYIGHSISGKVFVDKKKEISDGVGHEVNIRLGNYGEIYITFGEKFRQAPSKWKEDGRKLVLERTEDQEYEGYTYAFRTNNKYVPDELKIGHCTDPEDTLKTYARGHSNVRFILLVPESKYFNENIVKSTLTRAGLKLQSQDGRKGGGEFFKECDKLYRILKTMLDRLPEDAIKASVIPEGIQEAFAED